MTETAISLRTEQTSPALSNEPSLSDKLSALLTSGESPVVGPKAAAALRAYAEGPWPELAMPTPERADSMIVRLAVATKERRLSIAEQKERMEIYWRVLRDIPLVDLAAGFDQIVATRTFMPTPAEIRSICGAFTAKREYRRSRARHLAWLHDQHYQPPVDPVPAGEVAALLAGVAVGTSAAEQAVATQLSIDLPDAASDPNSAVEPEGTSS